MTTVNDAPVITSNGGGATASIAIYENTSAVTTITANDPDAGTNLTYSIVGGADAARFMIDAGSGQLSLAVPADFEAPTDVNTDRVFDVVVAVSDGILIDTQEISVSILDVNPEVLMGTPGIDIIYGGPSDDQLFGLASNDILYGLAGNDLLGGGSGADTMLGGTGDDIYVVDNAADVVTELASSGMDTVRSSVAYVLGVELENLVLQGAAAISGTGNALANTLDGSQNTAANSLDGGLGDDTYIVGTGDTIVEAAGAGRDVVLSSINHTLATNVEVLVLQGSSAISSTGNALDNVLSGAENTAANALARGGGNDTYIVGAGDTATEAAGAGLDQVWTGLATFTLGANLEALIGTSATGQTLIGNSIANAIVGGVGNDWIDGGTGTDVMAGLAGDDTYVVDVAGDIVFEAAGEGIDTIRTALASYSLAAMPDIENLIGTADAAVAQTLIGNAGNNTIAGGAGTNTIEGGLGNDVLDGGAGTDTVTYANAVADVAVLLSVLTAQDTIGDGVDTLANFENLVGSAFNDLLQGTAGNNVLNGGAGTADRVSYANAAAGVTVSLAITTAQNTVGAGTDTLSNFEGILGSSFADTLTGSTAADTLEGGDGSDTLIGGAGADNLSGGDSNDTLIGGAGADVLNGGSGIDTASWSGSAAVTINRSTGTHTGDAAGDTFILIEQFALTANADNFTGNAENETIDGAAGNDVLNGGLGNNILTGGVGADAFVFNTALGFTNVDSITDFSVIDDTIRLENGIMTGLGTTTGTLAATAFFIGSAAADASDRIIYDAITGDVYYDADGTGATSAIRIASLNTGLALTNQDFLII